MLVVLRISADEYYWLHFVDLTKVSFCETQKSKLLWTSKYSAWLPLPFKIEGCPLIEGFWVNCPLNTLLKVEKPSMDFQQAQQSCARSTNCGCPLFAHICPKNVICIHCSLGAYWGWLSIQRFMYCLKHNKPKSIHILKQKQELRVTVKWSGTLSKFPGHKSMLGEFLLIFFMILVVVCWF